MKASTFAVASGVSALVAASALFLGAATALQKLNSGPAVIIPVGSWKWFSSVKVNLEQAPQNVAGIPDAVIPQLPTALPKPVAPKRISHVAHHKKVATAYHFVSRRIPSLEDDFVPKWLHRKPVEVAAAPVDIHFSAPAPEAEEPIRVESAHPEMAPADEVRKLQDIHSVLRDSFFVAMTQFELNTQYAKIDEAPATLVEDAGARVSARMMTAIQVHHRKVVKRTVPAIQVKNPEPEVDSTLVEVVTEAPKYGNFQQLVERGLPEVSQPAQSEKGTDHLALHAAAPSANEAGGDAKLSDSREEIDAETPASLSTPPQTAPPLYAADEATPQIAPPRAPIHVEMPAAAKPETAPAPSATSVTTHGGVLFAMNQVGYSPINAYSKPAIPATPPVVPHVEQPPVTHADTPPTHTDSSIRTTLSAFGFDGGAAGPGYVEAFDWSTALPQAWDEQMTSEGKNGRGWKIAHQADHWPTVHWYSDSAVPIVSTNSIFLLSRKIGAPIQASAGILIAKVPSGWTADFSGRSERPLIFDSKNQLVANGQTDGERYFTFLNAAPGAHLVYMTRAGSAQSGVVALPILAGKTSYVDATLVNHKSLQGVVLDGEASSAKGLSHVEVRVAGDGQPKAITAENGSFRIDDVTVFSDHTVVIESEASTGYTHRYHLKPNQLGHATLFRLSERQVQDSIGQLEGGISPESGMVLSALPSLVASEGDGKLSGLIRSLSASPTLQPETYTMASNGQLSTDHRLTGNTSRFMGLQIPEGPAIAEAIDTERHIAWSELLVVSPGVIDLVGPY